MPGHPARSIRGQTKDWRATALSKWKVQGWVALIALVCLLAAWPLPSGAQTGSLFSSKNAPSNLPATSALLASAANVVKTDQVRAELLVHAPEGIRAGQTFWLGLQIEHQPHWHTYWQNPGDSGLPTRLQWQLPAGLQAGDIAWPLPKKIPIGTLANYGYENRLMLTVPVTVGADFRFPDGGPLTLGLQAEWLVCRQECIPQEGRFSLQLTSAAPQKPNAAGFETAQKLSPQALPQLQQGGTWITGGQATLSADAKQINLRVHGLPVGWRGQTLSAFPVTPNVVHNAAVQGKDWTQSWQGAVWSAQIPVSEERGDSPTSMRWVIAAGPESAPKAPAFEIETPVQGTWPALAQAAPAEISPALAKALAENASAAQKPAASSTTALGLTLAVLAALVEESSAAADSLKAQAASMLQAIGQFDAGASAVPSPASRIRSPALRLTRPSVRVGCRSIFCLRVARLECCEQALRRGCSHSAWHVRPRPGGCTPLAAWAYPWDALHIQMPCRPVPHMPLLASIPMPIRCRIFGARLNASPAQASGL
eukprot:gene32689-40346_t